MSIKSYDVLLSGSTFSHIGVPFNYSRGSAGPLDNTTVWTSLLSAEAYARGDFMGAGAEAAGFLSSDGNFIPYVGQLLTVKENDTYVTYVIENEAGQLKKVGDTESLNPTITALSNAISTNIDAIDALETKADALSDAISANIDAIGALETKADALSDAISANIDAIAANATSITAINEEIESIKEATSSDLSSLENKLSSELSITVEKQTDAEDGYLATYIVKQGGEQVGASINIPKDFLVKSATVKTCETAGKPVADYVVGDKYLDFVLNTADTEAGTEDAKHVYIKLTDLVDVYTGGETDTITVNVVNGVITTTLKNGSVTTDHLKDGAVTNAKLGLSAVATNNIQDSAITEVKISDGAVSEGKIKEDAVTTGKIKDQAVTSAKLATDSVTTTKIVDKAVTTAKLDDGAVTTDKIANKAVTRDKLSDELTTALDSFATKTALEAEVKSRSDADTELDGKITAEVTRATGVESELSGKIIAETTRAEGIESGLRTDLDGEISRSTDKDAELTQAIADEATAARAAEQALGERIDALDYSQEISADSVITKIEQVDGKVSVTTGKIKIDASQVDGLPEALTDFAKLTDLNAVSSDLNTRLNTVSSDLDTLSGTVESNKTALEGSIKTVSDNLAALSGTVINTVSSDLNKLEGTVEGLTKTVGDNKTELEGSISKVATDLGALSGVVINTVSSDLDKLEADVGTLQTNLEGEIAKKLAIEDFAKLSVEIGLDAATKDNKVVTQKDIADLTGAMHFKGIVTKQAGESDLAAIERVFPDAVAGDIVMIQDSTLEYVYNGKAWMQLGDETVYVTKPVFDQKVEELVAVDSAISTAVDNKILINDEKLESLKIYHVTQDEYHNKVVDGSILSNELYIVSSDTINAYGERIVNVGAPSVDTDAANKKYVDDSVKTVSDTASGIDERVTELSGKALFGVTLNGQTVSVTNNIANLVIDVIECGSAAE